MHTLFFLRRIAQRIEISFHYVFLYIEVKKLPEASDLGTVKTIMTSAKEDCI